MITIQLDCAIAENFDMYYVDQNGEKETSLYHPSYFHGLL